MAHGLWSGVRFAALVAVLALVLAPAAARAKLKIESQGYVETDVRFGLPGKAFEREEGTLRFNENRFGYQVDAKLNEHVSARAAGRVVFVGFSDTTGQLRDPLANPPKMLSAFDLTQRAKIDPFWWELDAAYVDLKDIGVEGFDIRLGRQVIHWGTSDQFNPTNNINPYDFRDPLLFGQNLANNALKLDYTPGRDIVFTGVWVPIFRSSQLPLSGLRLLRDPSAFSRRYGSSPLIDAFAGAGANFNYTIDSKLPNIDLKNSMAAAKFAWKLFGGDFSVSYFRGPFSLPRPEKITPILSGGRNEVNVQLGYPMMQAIGFDFTTSIDALKGLGFWVEGAVVFHDALETKLDLGGPPLDQTLVEGPAGQFFKLTVGIDYSFHRQLYMNIQYLHGFVDEFGSRQINDYVVAGFDLKSKSEKWMLRLFGILNLQDKSHVYYPVLIMKPWAGTEFHAGALLYGGNTGTKFGGLESGSNLFYIKGRVSF